jgi:hypothetical protein
MEKQMGSIVKTLLCSIFRSLIETRSGRRHHLHKDKPRLCCPYDISCVESFFATRKKECIYRRKNVALEEVETDAFEYVELFYNQKRMNRFG